MAAQESSVDPSVHSAVMTVLSGEVTAAGQSRTRRFDQLAEDSASLWAIAMTSPTIYAAQSIRMLNGTPGQFSNAVEPTPAK